MKQGILRGFGAAHLTGAIAPIDMPAEVVAMCNSEADAILHSINFAKARFGFLQADIAKLMGLRSDSHLSAYKSGAEAMPEKHYRRFAQVTGCNLIEQYHRTQEVTSGKDSANERNKVALALMLRAAA
jgi:hypothetical protein